MGAPVTPSPEGSPEGIQRSQHGWGHPHAATEDPGVRVGPGLPQRSLTGSNRQARVCRCLATPGPITWQAPPYEEGQGGCVTWPPRRVGRVKPR